MQNDLLGQESSRLARLARVLRSASTPALLSLALFAACNDTKSDGSQSGSVGNLTTKPGGGLYFVDPNGSGDNTRLRIAQINWGRLVDVHGIDPLTSEPTAQPVFQDLVINENVQTDGTRYEIVTNPITQQTRLVVLRDPASSDFASLVRQAIGNLPPVTAKNDNGTSPGPFSFIARNAALVIRFDDLLDDSSAALTDLPKNVNVLTGYPPILPFTARRMIFDPNHGAVVSGRFHSTRVVIDMTVSEAEAASSPPGSPAPQVNSLGLPASLVTTDQANVSVRIPSVVSPIAGQSTILRSLGGAPMSTTGNGPVDFGVPTVDVVRALRSGNSTDSNNGFLLDLNQPEIVGGWPLAITAASDDPAGDPGFDFLADLSFGTLCQTRPEVGDIITINGSFVEVTQLGAPPDTSGSVSDVRIRLLSDNPVPLPQVLLGGGVFLSTFDPAVPVPTGCWVSFTPPPTIFPAIDVPPDAQVLVRFTEPMDPQSVTPFDTFLVNRGAAPFDPDIEPEPLEIVVGKVTPSSDLKDYTFTPALPMNHTEGLDSQYHIRLQGGLSGITDLAGNSLRQTLPFVNFDLDDDAVTESNGGFVLRFNGIAEFNVDTPITQKPDFRGQIFYDFDRGLIKPRPVTRQGVPADRNNPVPGLMIPFPLGVQTPLSPLGSKLQTLYRYCDVGWLVSDETKYNIDIEGISWSPIGGQIVADFYDEFEMRLAHSERIPDEYVDANLLPIYQQSGLHQKTDPYTANILQDPLAPQVIVHPRSLGYPVNPIDLFLTGSGTPMMPYPWNRRGAPPNSYTWRDTAVLAKAGPNGTGIPLAIECYPPLNIYGPYPPVNPPPGTPPCEGGVAPAGQVPSHGLPLLMEFRCYPSDSGVGLNSFDISLAINSSSLPNFRAFSTGGLNVAQQQVFKNPDLEVTPSGGFNPRSSPPGAPTLLAVDNSFYIGQLDTVPRISRSHSIWFNTQTGSPSFLEPLLEPAIDDQPAGTRIDLHFRGATGFNFTGNDDRPFDASSMNPYGDVGTNVLFLNGVRTWTNDVANVDGARYVQLRLTFVSNIETDLSPELSAFGLAWED